MGLLLLIILFYPVHYSLKWTHNDGEKHRLKFMARIFSGIGEVHYLLKGNDEEIHYVLLGREVSFRKKPEPEPEPLGTEKEKESAPATGSKSRITGGLARGRSWLQKFSAREMVKILGEVLKEVWRWIKSHNVQADISYGLGNPMHTGQVYGMFWAFRILPSDAIQVRPNYIARELTGFAIISGYLSFAIIIWKLTVVGFAVFRIFIRRRVQRSPVFSKNFHKRKGAV